MNENLIFALDIGTRTVVGILAERLADNTLEVLEIEVEEHPKRSMIGGQIHDIPQVAQTITNIKARMEANSGYKLRQAAVAAAGRSLITTKGSAELEFVYPQEVSDEIYHALVLDAVRNAQQTILGSGKAKGFHCVGYSVTEEFLDGVPLGSLLGQIGNKLHIKLIATFLPHMIVDSLHNALRIAGLDIKYITLEPIAAMNLVVPDNVRQLNVALVDIGAGTSDIAVSEKGTISDYAMLPVAGDKVSEALCQEYLLDFSMAEDVKKQLGKDLELIALKDITGTTCSYTKEELISAIQKTVEQLSHDISKKIIEVNGKSPQVVLCIGGGSLTPNLQTEMAKFLSLPEYRVVIADKEIANPITKLTDKLSAPQAITPLAILMDTLYLRNLQLHTVLVNKRPVRLFAINHATAGDALVAAGISPSQYLGKLGPALSFEVNGKIVFIKGKPGIPGKIRVDGKEGDLVTMLQEGSDITFTPGIPGSPGQEIIKNILPFALIGQTFLLNDIELPIISSLKVNNENVDGLDRPILDGDSISYIHLKTIMDAINFADPESLKKGSEIDVFLNGEPCQNMKQHLNPGDILKITNKKKVDQKGPLDVTKIKIKLNGDDILIPKISPTAVVILTDVFKVLDFVSEEVKGKKLIMKVNDTPANFMTGLNEGDIVTVRWEEQN
ncbi:MAG: cell division FtsA domain-containing protein [Bacillota bacterium]